MAHPRNVVVAFESVITGGVLKGGMESSVPPHMRRSRPLGCVMTERRLFTSAKRLGRVAGEGTVTTGCASGFLVIDMNRPRQTTGGVITKAIVRSGVPMTRRVNKRCPTA